MRDKRRFSIAAWAGVLRGCGLWLMLLTAAAALMPKAGPVMQALFPGVPHPVYTRASFLELTVAHIELVALSSMAAAAAGIGLGLFVTRESGREFAAITGAAAAIAQTFPPVAVLALAIPLLGYGAAPAVLALFL
ncbi:MAG TPA: ABC transporter permease, partial [Methylocella sp.]|nr:ABC transporter permease [Methylocella sp.]